MHALCTHYRMLSDACVSPPWTGSKWRRKEEQDTRLDFNRDAKQLFIHRDCVTCADRGRNLPRPWRASIRVIDLYEQSVAD